MTHIIWCCLNVESKKWLLLFSCGTKELIYKTKTGLPVSPVVKNSPCNAGNMGLIPGLGRFHMPQNNQVGMPQLLSPYAASTEAVCCKYLSPHALEPELHNKRIPQWKAHAQQLESSPHLPQLKKACVQQHRPSTAKNNFF